MWSASYAVEVSASVWREGAPGDQRTEQSACRYARSSEEGVVGTIGSIGIVRGRRDGYARVRDNLGRGCAQFAPGGAVCARAAAVVAANSGIGDHAATAASTRRCVVGCSAAGAAIATASYRTGCGASHCRDTPRRTASAVCGVGSPVAGAAHSGSAISHVATDSAIDWGAATIRIFVDGGRVGRTAQRPSRQCEANVNNACRQGVPPAVRVSFSKRLMRSQFVTEVMVQQTLRTGTFGLSGNPNVSC